MGVPNLKLRRFVFVVLAIETAMPALAYAQPEPAGFLEGQMVVSLDSTPTELAALGAGVQLGKFLTSRWSLGFGFESLHDSTPRESSIESDLFLGYFLLVAHHRSLTNRLEFEATFGMGGLKTTTDFATVRRTYHYVAFPIGLGLPIRLARDLLVVPRVRIAVAPLDLDALVTLHVGLRWEL